MTKPHANAAAMDAMDMDVDDEDCPLCCDHYDESRPERRRIVCSALDGCASFSVCRLCVFRRDLQLRARPFVVDDDTGDFVELDPTACPQCKRPGAFQEDALPPLSEEIRRAEEEQTRRSREEAERRARDRALRRLDGAPGAAGGLAEATGRTRRRHERIKIISGHRDPEKFRVARRGGGEVCSFRGEGGTTIGVPDFLSSSSGVIYYEIVMKGELLFFLAPKIQFGFSLADGMEVTDGHSEASVGDNIRSWGFDGLTGQKYHVVPVGDDRSRSRWGPYTVVGIAANLDKGMIAVAVDGDWRLANRNGVKFEHESIKGGVYPCITGKACKLECRFGPENFEHGPPPSSLWDAWPRFDDRTWLGLTEGARAAAMALGYTQQSWMGSGNPIEKKDWAELSEEEKAAADALGYSSGIWAQLTALWADDDGGSDSDNDSDDEDDGEYSPQDFFTSVPWGHLPGDARRAAEALGYTSVMWDDDDVEGPLDDKGWDEMTAEQQRGAIVLGYDERTWNGDDGGDSLDNDDSSDSDSSDSDSSDDNGGLPFDHMSWQELPRNVREAAGKLGYTALTWDQDLKGPWDEKRWGEMPLEQQFAAAVLGYDEAKWNRSIDFAHDLASLVFLGRPRQR